MPLHKPEHFHGLIYLKPGNNHDCFRKVRHQHSANWTEERAMQAVLCDRSLQYNKQKREQEVQQVRARLNRDGDRIGLDYIGLKDFLYAERKLPLVCHHIGKHLVSTW